MTYNTITTYIGTAVFTLTATLANGKSASASVSIVVKCAAGLTLSAPSISDVTFVIGTGKSYPIGPFSFSATCPGTITYVLTTTGGAAADSSISVSSDGT